MENFLSRAHTQNANHKKKREILHIKGHCLQKVKTQAQNWEKIFALHMTEEEKRIVS